MKITPAIRKKLLKIAGELVDYASGCWRKAGRGQGRWKGTDEERRDHVATKAIIFAAVKIYEIAEWDEHPEGERLELLRYIDSIPRRQDQARALVATAAQILKGPEVVIPPAPAPRLRLVR